VLILVFIPITHIRPRQPQFPHTAPSSHCVGGRGRWWWWGGSRLRSAGFNQAHRLSVVGTIHTRTMQARGGREGRGACRKSAPSAHDAPTCNAWWLHSVSPHDSLLESLSSLWLSSMQDLVRVASPHIHTIAKLSQPVTCPTVESACMARVTPTQLSSEWTEPTLWLYYSYGAHSGAQAHVHGSFSPMGLNT
jgi:hypothetical protein